jgi:hypothetical protein
MQQLKTIHFACKFAATQLHLKSIKKNDKGNYYEKAAEYGKWTRAYLSELGPLGLMPSPTWRTPMMP